MRQRGGGSRRFTRKYTCLEGLSAGAAAHPVLDLPAPASALGAPDPGAGGASGSGCGTRPQLRAEGLQLPAP